MTKNRQQGFTLVEALVALSVLMVALTGITSLMLVNLANARAAQESLIGAHLAQEGLEIVRSLRDADSFAEDPFGTSLPDGDYIVQWDSDQLDPLGSNPVLKLDSLGLYNYSTGNNTVFRRSINIESVNPGEEIRATVVVEWKVRGRDFNLTAESHLFNWFQP